MPLLAVEDLRVAINGSPVINGVDLTLDRGSTLALVGESGSGKTMTALSLIRLLPNGARATGRVIFDGDDLLLANETAMCDRRGRSLAMIFQEPMTALNPLQTIAAQVAETVLVHHRASHAEAHAIALDALDRVGLPAARIPASRYPHQLSGGERQRVLVAIATVLKPKLIIADEPTSALDVTAGAHVLDLLKRLVAEDGSALILISHDLATVAAMADRLAIMRRGTIVEAGDAPGIFRSLRHPYSKALLAAANYSRTAPPRRRRETTASPLLTVANVTRDYRVASAGLFGRRRHVRAVDNVSFTIEAGETVALVGESGSGKSTLARVVLALDKPDAGRVLVGGVDFLPARGEARRAIRRRVQAVFQDPYGSFDPRLKVHRAVAEPLALDRPPPDARESRKRADEMLVAVGLSSADGDKYPHEFSGGERQRLAIARALITRPALVVLDEPVSALDVSLRTQVLDLLARVREEFGVAFLFISHDLAVVRAVADRILVMRAGKIVEEGDTEQVFGRPRHPYTAALLAAAPDLDRALAVRERNSVGQI
jgi:peptide/nickel transport system ATP-binding protein